MLFALEKEICQELSDLAEIANILESSEPLSRDKIEFTYQIVQKTLTSLISDQYSDFDAQTTSTCCHGVSLLVRDLILQAQGYDLHGYLKDISNRLENDEIIPTFSLPKVLIFLSQLYILTFIRQFCPKIGARTQAKKLKEIAPLSVDFFDKLVKTLQKKYSNQVAFRYQYCLDAACDIETCGVSIKLWGKYITPSYLRRSSGGLYFASSLYSMQVTLAYLIVSKGNIALVNDIFNKEDEHKDRYVKILKGNGTDGFEPLKVHEENMNEPVVVFGGCAYHENPEDIKLKMIFWEDQFPNLVLAHEITYPQFPRICDDAQFGNMPLIPEEEILQQTIAQHKKVKGVSAGDPSLYCLTHIYPSSVKQILSNELPPMKIPASWKSEVQINSIIR